MNSLEIPQTDEPTFSTKRPSAAFTLIELLAAAAILSLLIFTILPAYARNRASTEATLCMANLRQIHLAWQNYANNYDGLLVASLDTATIRAQNRVPWVRGFSGGSESDAVQLNRSPLRPYIDSIKPFLCPADKTLPSPRTRLPRKGRSYSMSQVFDEGFWLPNSAYRTYARLDQIVLPDRTFVMIDEHPASINDGAFGVQIAESGSPSARIIDMPANYHTGGAGLNFADGRAELRYWRGRRIRVPQGGVGGLVLNIPAGDAAADIVWLSQRTTVRR